MLFRVQKTYVATAVGTSSLIDLSQERRLVGADDLLCVEVLSCKVKRSSGAAAATFQPCISVSAGASAVLDVDHLLLAAAQAVGTPFGDAIPNRVFGAPPGGLLYFYAFPNVGGDTFWYELILDLQPLRTAT